MKTGTDQFYDSNAGTQWSESFCEITYQGRDYEFTDQEDAQKFLDELPSRVGVEIRGGNRLFQLLNEIGAPMYNWQEVNAEICNEWSRLFGSIKSESDYLKTTQSRVALLQLFTTVMDAAQTTVAPESLKSVRAARDQQYNSFIFQESMVGENVCAETLIDVTQREISAGRMLSDNRCRQIAEQAMVEGYETRQEMLEIQNANMLQAEASSTKVQTGKNMAINIFEGARRIALLLAGGASIVTVIVAFNESAYYSAQYSLAAPNAPFRKTDGDCPSEGSRTTFDYKTSNGKEIGVAVCLEPMTFTYKNNNETAELIPYRTDADGMTWGGKRYSTEVSAYEKQVEKRFTMSATDEEDSLKEISKKWRSQFAETMGYLVAGLAIFASLVWAIGWTVRGFLGIPRGMDKRPDL